MFDDELYQLTQSLSGAFAVGMRLIRAAEQPDPLPDLYRLRAGLAESPGWFMVQALEFDPQPLTVADLRVRDIYASERLVTAILELMASEKWLHRRGEAYFLSEEGRKWQQLLRDNVGRWLSALQPLPPAEMERLESLMWRPIVASLQSPDPPGTWCLAHSRNRAPAADSSPPVKIYQYVADFNAFRDDAHMAAWQPLAVDGRTWEAFSLVAKERAFSAPALFDQLAYRGYALEDYDQALAVLAGKGWLETVNGQAFQVTGEGRQILEAVEHLTDDYFFGPWSVLSPAEVEELIALINRCGEALQAMAR